MCWDNTFSHFNSKTVFFEIIVESDDDDERDPWDVDFENYDGLSPEEFYDMKVQDIQVRFCGLRCWRPVPHCCILIHVKFL